MSCQIARPWVTRDQVRVLRAIATPAAAPTGRAIDSMEVTGTGSATRPVWRYRRAWLSSGPVAAVAPDGLAQHANPRGHSAGA
jgi:hypothetical protein